MADPKAPADKSTKIPATPTAAAPADDVLDDLDDTGQPWRHPPIAPKDEDPLKSLGRSVSEAVTGPLKDKDGKPKP